MSIQIRLAAKSDLGSVRKNNEDNFHASADIAQGMTWVSNQTLDLGRLGALLVVADGMGGMNAGEVASQIAIDTVKEFFAAERITPEVLKTRYTIEKYMKDVVREADKRIKTQSTSETRGMGTTIVMAWLYNGQCYVCWCGDSRAYIYNPANGLFQVSKDHSYVQSLVDAGKITEEQAFDYPESNVITRCLCDASNVAEPECLLNPQPLCNGDIIMLCSDGLSGLLRDRDMQQIIAAGTDNIDTLADNLIAAANRAGGTDNITVAMAQVLSGGAKSTSARVPKKKSVRSISLKPKGTRNIPGWLMALIGALIAAAIVFVIAYFVFGEKSEESNDDDDTEEVQEEQVNPQDQHEDQVTPNPIISITEEEGSDNKPTKNKDKKVLRDLKGSQTEDVSSDEKGGDDENNLQDNLTLRGSRLNPDGTTTQPVITDEQQVQPAKQDTTKRVVPKP